MKAFCKSLRRSLAAKHAYRFVMLGQRVAYRSEVSMGFDRRYIADLRFYGFLQPHNFTKWALDRATA